MSPEDRFKRELENYYRDATAAAQFLYCWIAFHHFVGRDAALRKDVNVTPLFWNTILGALQTSLFITLGRIFDEDPRSHSIHKLLDIAVNNQRIFSRAALAARKRKTSPGATWIKQYVRDASIPTSSDFDRVSRYVTVRVKTYGLTYKKIRHKIFAHAGAITDQGRDELFSGTKIAELERLVVSLCEVHEVLWQLLENGRKPVFRRSQYTVKSLYFEATKKKKYSRSVAEQVVYETNEAIRKIRGA
jgi:hypothetical protein